MNKTFVAVIHVELPDGSDANEFAGDLVEQTERLVNAENLILQKRGDASAPYGQITDMQIFSQVP